jgi:lysosomal Pro-X carboxypeptidase
MNMSVINAHCKREYGFDPRREGILSDVGGAGGGAAASNNGFSNGLYDPWSSGGVAVKEASAADSRVAELGINKSVKAVVIDHGAHHLDLMFANPKDPKGVLDARKLELEQIAIWTREANRFR